MTKMIILANRLAEAVLFDWDKEEVVKLAKEVAIVCKENIDFTSLVRKMREAQQDCIYKSMFSTMGNTNMAAYSAAVTKRKTLEFQVDDMIKEMEDLK